MRSSCSVTRSTSKLNFSAILSSVSVSAAPATEASRVSCLSGCLQLGQLLAYVLSQIAAHPDHACIVLVQHLIFLQTRPQPAKYFAILLQHFPMSRLQSGLVKEAPHVALPPAHL